MLEQTKPDHSSSRSVFLVFEQRILVDETSHRAAILSRCMHLKRSKIYAKTEETTERDMLAMMPFFFEKSEK